MEYPLTQTTNLKPVTKWVGGKRQLLPQLSQFIPSNYERYYEPFVGGGALLFSLAPDKVTINDMNAELIQVYQVIKENPEELLRLLEHHASHNTKEYYLEIRNLDRDGTIDQMSAVERSARILYMLRVDFNGLYRVNKKGQFNVPYGRNKNPKIANRDNIMAVSNYFNKIDIEFLNTDFENSVQTANKRDFVYFDPPYIPLTLTSDFTSYTANGFTLKDQERLRNLFFELAKSGTYVMLSNSDTQLTRELYADANIHEALASRSINSNGKKRGKIGELIITSY
ncbi:MAG: DNA adenine methylase [Lactobacillus sp.]|jgi:DNA adenine methylase|nr:DNA adenine methylase [Lactobacillus sp.]